jgi:hypothetical protein
MAGSDRSRTGAGQGYRAEVIAYEAAKQQLGKRLYGTEWIPDLTGHEKRVLQGPRPQLPRAISRRPRSDEVADWPKISIKEYDQITMKHENMVEQHKQVADCLVRHGFEEPPFDRAKFAGFLLTEFPENQDTARSQDGVTSSGSAAVPQRQDRGGRPREYPYDSLPDELIQRIRSEGEPETKDELIRWAQEILTIGDRLPDREGVRKHLSIYFPKLYEACGKAKKQF